MEETESDNEGGAGTFAVFTLLVFVVGLLLGVLVGRLAMTKPETVANAQQREASTQMEATRTESVGSQAPVTYSRHRTQPRFVPLPEHAHG